MLARSPEAGAATPKTFLSTRASMRVATRRRSAIVPRPPDRLWRSIERMVRAGLEQQRPEEPPPSRGEAVAPRFARPSSHFAVEGRARTEKEGAHDEH